MMRSPFVKPLALLLIFGGAVHATEPSSRGPECPNGYTFGSECIEANALTECTSRMNSVYGADCDPLCAHCSSLGNFNCFTTQSQCTE